MLQTNTAMPESLGNNSMNETSGDPNLISEEPTLFFAFDTNSSYNDIYELTNIPLVSYSNFNSFTGC